MIVGSRLGEPELPGKVRAEDLTHSGSHRALGLGIHCQPQDRRQHLDSASGSGHVLIVHSDLSSLPPRFKGPSGITYVLSRAASLLPDFGTCNGCPRVSVTMEG